LGREDSKNHIFDGVETSHFQNILANHGRASQESQNQVKTLSCKNVDKSNLSPPPPPKAKSWERPWTSVLNMPIVDFVKGQWQQKILLSRFKERLK
jgi:hypothetical protein